MTQLQIVNLALGNLGMPAITQAQLTASVHPSAVAANLYWEPCRDEVLGEHNWSFATSTLGLSAISTTDSVWEYVYSYPTLAVGSVWAVYNDGTTEDRDEQEFEVKYYATTGVRAIYSNLDSAYAEFTYKVTDPEIWSTNFSLAFSYRLASSMALPLMGDASIGLKMMDIYNGMIQEAKRIGGREKVKKPNQPSSYIDAR